MRITTKEIVIIVFLIAVAFIRYFYFLPTPSSEYYKFVDEKVSFTGMVSEYPDKRENQVRLSIKPENQDFKIIVPVYDSGDEYHYGDVVEVSGILTEPENFETDTGKIFDYQKYLFAHDTFFIIKSGTVEKVGESGGRIKKILFYAREKFEKSLDRVLPYGDSGFMKGLLLGDKGGINDEDKDAFVTTGTIHIVALSGFNVMIVADAFMRAIGVIATGAMAYVSGGISIILFVIMAGGSATAVRAGLMAIISLFAQFSGRTYTALRALVIVSLLMLVFNPRTIWDVSFHLSVLATFGIITLPTKILKYFRWIPKWRGFREIMLATISASIMVIPYIMYVMGSLSIVSLLANALILPIISYLMFFGFISGFIGLFSSAISIPFAYIAHLGSAYIFLVVHFFAKLPFASVNIKNFPLIIILAFYVWLLRWVFKND
jgi:competence protein ComEC